MNSLIVVEIEDHVMFDPEGWGEVVTALSRELKVHELTLSPRRVKLTLSLLRGQEPRELEARARIVWEEAKTSVLLRMLNERDKVRCISTDVPIVTPKEV